MQRTVLVLVGIVSLAGSAVAALWQARSDDDKPAAASVRLPEKWREYVTVKDLTDEINDSVGRMGQNLKKPSDFDKFLKTINTEAHLTAVLAELVRVHPDAGNWKSNAAELQEQALAVAKAAEAKGGKNFRAAQDAHKKILELSKKKVEGNSGSGSSDESSDWVSLGALGDVMKRVEPCYKYIRGKMSSEAAFKKEAESIRHNAAMLYVFGQISPAFRPAEKDMDGLSAAMSSGSTSLLEAVKSSDFAKANDANTAINAACNECHKVKRFQKKGSDLDF